jgi:hypothetical protein
MRMLALNAHLAGQLFNAGVNRITALFCHINSHRTVSGYIETEPMNMIFLDIIKSFPWRLSNQMSNIVTLDRRTRDLHVRQHRLPLNTNALAL